MYNWMFPCPSPFFLGCILDRRRPWMRRVPSCNGCWSSIVLIGQSDRAVVKFSTVYCVDLHVVKEVAMLRKEATLITFFTFLCHGISWQSQKSIAFWLNGYHYRLQWEDEMIPYSMAKRLIIMTAIGAEESDDNKALR